MKRLFTLFTLIIAIALLVACATPTVAPTTAPKPAEPTKAPAPKQVTITFYQRGYTAGGTDVTSVTTDKAIEIFQKNNPNIKINLVGIPWTTEGDTKLEAALAAKTDINLFRVTSVNLPRYAKQGVLSEITPFLTDDDKNDFYPSGFQVATIDGKVWAWPLWVTAISTFANTDIFKERGVDLPTMAKPWTWDQFVDACKKLTYKKADGTQVYGFQSSSAWGAVEYYPLMYIDGGRILSEDGKKFVQNQPNGISALQKIADLALVHKCTPPDFGTVDQVGARAQFKERKTIAMLMSTPGFMPDLENNKFPVAAIPPPTGTTGKLVTNGAFGLYTVVKVDDQDKLKAAHEFAKYLTGSQVAKDITGWQQAPGLRRSNTGYATSPNREVIAKLVEFGVYEAPVATPAELGNNYGAALQAIILGKKTAKQAMDDIAPDYQKELDALNK